MFGRTDKTVKMTNAFSVTQAVVSVVLRRQEVSSLIITDLFFCLFLNTWQEKQSIQRF